MTQNTFTLKANNDLGTLYLTPSAAERLSELLKDSAQKHFRITVDSGGCSGFQYKFDLDEVSNPDDIQFQQKNVRIVTDPISMPFLEGIIVDFVEDLMGSAFALKNPNATQSCGCGNSFSI